MNWLIFFSLRSLRLGARFFARKDAKNAKKSTSGQDMGELVPDADKVIHIMKYRRGH
jgi:hypothetical protein